MQKKAEMIGAKKLPMALFGCELAPVNEGAMRTLRSAFASCLTYTTTRRSLDLTFAAGSIGPDVDPDIEVVSRRLAAVRRSMAKSEE